MKWITPLIIAVARMAVVIASMVQRTGHAYQDVTLVFVTQISAGYRDFVFTRYTP